MDKKRSSIAVVLGRQIKSLRLKEGLSQEALAEKVGISQTYLAALENAKKFPTDRVMEALSEAFGVRYFELFLDPENMGDLNSFLSEGNLEQFQVELLAFVKTWAQKNSPRTDPNPEGSHGR